MAMFVNGSDLNEQFYRGPSKDASYKVSIHLSKRFRGKDFFTNQQIGDKKGLWRSCLLMDRDKMSNL